MRGKRRSPVPLPPQQPAAEYGALTQSREHRTFQRARRRWVPLALVWRRDNLSPLLSRFVADVGSLVKARPTAR